jgi:hypothetical protein
VQQSNNVHVEVSQENQAVSKIKITFLVVVSISVTALLVSMVLYVRTSTHPVGKPTDRLQIVGPTDPQQLDVFELVSMSPVNTFGHFRRGDRPFGVGPVLLRCKVCFSWSGPFQPIDSGHDPVIRASSRELVHLAECSAR